VVRLLHEGDLRQLRGALAERKDSDHYLLMGPWTHGWNTYPLPSWNKSLLRRTRVRRAGPARLPGDAAALFDHYLKGEDTGATSRRSSTSRWGPATARRRATDGSATAASGAPGEEWPCRTPSSRPTTSTRTVGCRRTNRPPRTPRRATSSIRAIRSPPLGGNCSSYITYEPRDENLIEYPLANRNLHDITGRGGFDQRTRPDALGAESPYGPLEERNDVLVYRTEPLEEDLEITGPIRVSVFGSTDAPDTDFTAKLIDEYPPSEEFPNGFAVNLADSICRGRYRGYRDEPDLLEPGEVYEFEMEPYPTANVFKAGHRIRLDISSSNYPRFDVNHNTGGPLYGDRESQIATNTVHHDAEYATQIELPVQPR